MKQKVSRQVIALRYAETERNNELAKKKLMEEKRIDFEEFKVFALYKGSPSKLYNSLVNEKKRTMEKVRMYYHYLYMKDLLYTERTKRGASYHEIANLAYTMMEGGSK